MRSRFVVISFFVLLSIVSWCFLGGHPLGGYVAAIPILFSLQILLNDFIESYLFMKLDTFWFKLIIAPGTILHELSHACAAKLSGAQITSLSLFNLRSRSGNLGFVEYTQSPDFLSVVRSVFVGFAPFFGCGIVLLALLNMVWGPPGILSSLVLEPSNAASIRNVVFEVVLLFYQQFLLIAENPALALILYLQVCLGLGAAPSSADFKGTLASAVKHPLGSFILLSLAAAVLYLGYHPMTSEAVVSVFRWILLILILSTSLLIASIPLIFLGAAFTQVSFLKKTLSASLALLTYLLSESLLFSAGAFFLVLFLFRYSWLIVKEER